MDKRIGHTGEKLLKKCSFVLLGAAVLAGGGYSGGRKQIANRPNRVLYTLFIRQGLIKNIRASLEYPL